MTTITGFYLRGIEKMKRFLDMNEKANSTLTLTESESNSLN